MTFAASPLKFSRGQTKIKFINVPHYILKQFIKIASRVNLYMSICIVVQTSRLSSISPLSIGLDSVPGFVLAWSYLASVLVDTALVLPHDRVIRALSLLRSVRSRLASVLRVGFPRRRRCGRRCALAGVPCLSDIFLSGEARHLKPEENDR